MVEGEGGGEEGGVEEREVDVGAWRAWRKEVRRGISGGNFVITCFLDRALHLCMETGATRSLSSDEKRRDS